MGAWVRGRRDGGGLGSWAVMGSIRRDLFCRCRAGEPAHQLQEEEEEERRRRGGGGEEEEEEEERRRRSR